MMFKKTYSFLQKVKHFLTKNAVADQSSVRYSTYAQALKVCEAVGNAAGYQQEALCALVASKTTTYKTRMQEQVAATLNPESILPLHALNYLFSRQLINNNLTILDCGGACGAHYFELLRLMPADFAKAYIVLETPQMVAAAKREGLGGARLKFSDTVQDLPAIDFIYSSSALNYADDPWLLLQKLIALGAPFVLFNRMPFW